RNVRIVQAARSIRQRTVARNLEVLHHMVRRSLLDTLVPADHWSWLSARWVFMRASRSTHRFDTSRMPPDNSRAKPPRRGSTVAHFNELGFIVRGRPVAQHHPPSRALVR